MTINHQGQHQPAFFTAPYPAEIRRPTLVGRSVADTFTSIRGRLPSARLRTCQPFSWKIRCNVFLFIARRPVTVR